MTDPVSRELHDLHDTYVRKVNAALSADHDERAADLARDYPDEALRVLTS